MFLYDFTDGNYHDFKQSSAALQVRERQVRGRQTGERERQMRSRRVRERDR